MPYVEDYLSAPGRYDAPCPGYDMTAEYKAFTLFHEMLEAGVWKAFGGTLPSGTDSDEAIDPLQETFVDWMRAMGRKGCKP